MSAIEDNTLLNYMNQGNVQLENLWSIYPTSNSDIYESVFSGTYIVVFILSRYLDMYNDLVVISYKKKGRRNFCQSQDELFSIGIFDGFSFCFFNF